MAAPSLAQAWGFYAHKKINEHAVYTLPPPLLCFYKKHLAYVVENSVNADKRRYLVPGEAQRHFSNTDFYQKKAPKYWQEAKKYYTKEKLTEHGTLPWTIVQVMRRLTRAFLAKDLPQILRLSADLGHYIGDANVPLHTTENYDGQLTQQEGIHALWESRLPELFVDAYDFFVGQADYIYDPQAHVWEAVHHAYEAVPKVLKLAAESSSCIPNKQQFSFEPRGTTLRKTHTKRYAAHYHAALSGQVLYYMRRSIKMLGDFWYTAWVDAGRPDLSPLLKEATPAAVSIPQHVTPLNVWVHPE